MGKVPPKKRTGKKRHNPTGVVQTSAEIQHEIDTMMDVESNGITSSSNSIPLLAKLVCDVSGDRAWAAASIGNLLVDPSNRKQLLSANLIAHLVARIQNENHPEVLLEVTGALRNLVLHAPDVAGEFVRKNVLACIDKRIVEIRMLLEKQFSGVEPQGNEEDDARKAAFPLISNVFAVINSLCVATRTSINGVMSSTVTLPFLIDVLISADKFPVATISSAVSLLEIISEDNNELPKRLSCDAVERLGSLVAHDDIHVAVAAAGCLYNMRGSATSGAWVELLMNFFAHAVPAQSSLLADIAKYQSSKHPNDGRDEDTVMDLENHEGEKLLGVPRERAEDKEFDRLSASTAHASAVLELLANVSGHILEPDSNDGDEWLDDEEEIDDDGQSVDEEGGAENKETEMEALQEVAQRDKLAAVSSDDAALLQFVASTSSKLQRKFAAIVPHLLALAQASVVPPPAADMKGNKRALARQAQSLRIRSLAVLNNLFFAILALPKSKRGEHPFPVLNLLLPNLTASTKPREVVAALYQAFGQILSGILALDVDMTMETESTAPENALSTHDSCGSLSDLLSMVIGAIWGLLKNFDTNTDMGAASWVQIPVDEVANYVQLYYSPNASEEMKVKLIGLIGVLGKRQPGHIESNRVIGEHLMGLLRSPKIVPSSVLAETLNAVYDIYGDKIYDYDAPVFRQGNYLDCLRGAVEGVKNVVKSIDRRKQRDLRNSCDEALINLRAFIKYKEGEYRQ